MRRRQAQLTEDRKEQMIVWLMLFLSLYMSKDGGSTGSMHIHMEWDMHAAIIQQLRSCHCTLFRPMAARDAPIVKF